MIKYKCFWTDNVDLKNNPQKYSLDILDFVGKLKWTAITSYTLTIMNSVTITLGATINNKIT
jgi:hypothetical protein